MLTAGLDIQYDAVNLAFKMMRYLLRYTSLCFNLHLGSWVFV